jgi:hypothetical protein
MRCGAFVDASRIKQYTEEDFTLPETPPFSWLLRKTKEEIVAQEMGRQQQAAAAASPVTTPTMDEIIALKATETGTTTAGVTTTTINTAPTPTTPTPINNNSASVKSLESDKNRLSQSPRGDTYLCGTSPTSLLTESKRASRWNTKTVPDDDEKLLKELVSV